MMGFFVAPPCPGGTSSDCRLTDKNKTTTLLHWEPEFDDEGRQVNDDPNTKTETVCCSTCHACWAKTTIGGETTFTRIN